MKVDCRTPLKPMTMLGDYTIIDWVGFGGSAICYRAVHGQSGREIILKEIYPYVMAKQNQITREVVTQKLRISNEMQEEFNLYVQRQQAEMEICRALREGENSYLFFMEERVIDGTSYLLVDTDFGQMQSELMTRTENNGVAELASLEDVLGRTLRIVESLKPLHQMGYLHGDISPSNIHISKAQQGEQAGGRMARLIDFNNAVPLENARVWRFSTKEGYSPLEFIVPNLSHQICYGSDLYSVTAILFELIYGDTFDATEHLRKERMSDGKRRGTISSKLRSPYLDDADPEVKSSVQMFLYQGLVNRFADCVTMERAINKILQLIRYPHRLQSHFAPQNKLFLGRDDELQWVEHELQTNAVAVIQGIGGMGKSALNRAYAEKHLEDYKTIIWAPCLGNLMQTIADDSVFTITNYSMEDVCPSDPMQIGMGFDFEMKKSPKGDDVKRYYPLKLEKLRSILDKDTLVVVDGLDEAEDPNWDDLKSLPCHVLVSTRHALRRCTPYELTPIESEVESLAIVLGYHPSLVEADTPALRQLIAVTKGVPLFLELFAKVMCSAHLSPNEMAEGLSGVYDYPKERVEMDEETASVDVILARVMRLSALTKEERRVLQQFALLPDIGISFARAKTAFALETFDILNDLVRKGYLQVNNEEKTYYQHAVFADAACKVLKPTWESSAALREAVSELPFVERDALAVVEQRRLAHACLGFLRRLPWDMTIDTAQMPSICNIMIRKQDTERFVQLLSQIIKRGKFDVSIRAYLLLVLARELENIEDYEEAKLALEAIDILRNINKNIDGMLFDTGYYMVHAYGYQREKKYIKSLCTYRKAIKIHRKSQDWMYLVCTYVLLGELCEEANKYCVWTGRLWKFAMSHYVKRACYYVPLAEKTRVMVPDLYLRLGTLLVALSQEKLGMVYMQRVIDLCPKEQQYNSEVVMRATAYIGGVLADKKKWDLAISKFLSALEIAKAIEAEDGDENYSVVFLSQIGICYFEQNNYDTAKTYFEKTIEIKHQVTRNCDFVNEAKRYLKIIEKKLQ